MKKLISTISTKLVLVISDYVTPGVANCAKWQQLDFFSVIILSLQF